MDNPAHQTVVKQLFVCCQGHSILLPKPECEPMPNVMAALPNTGGALCSMLKSFADAQY